MPGYDKHKDYSDLIAQEAAKGVHADKTKLAQYEAARNAKIAGEGLDHAQTNLYTQELGRPRHYYTATDQGAYINGMYDAAREAQLGALEAAYARAAAGYDAAAAQIPEAYYQAKNATASDAEIARANVNEGIAASGLNTGAGSQVRLSQSNALQGSLSALDREKAARLSALEAERAGALESYQRQVAAAIAENELERAQALYSEAVRVDNSYVEASEELLARAGAAATPRATASPSAPPAAGGAGGAAAIPRGMYQQIGMNRTAEGRLNAIRRLLEAGTISEAQANYLLAYYGFFAPEAPAGDSPTARRGGGAKVEHSYVSVN